MASLKLSAASLMLVLAAFLTESCAYDSSLAAVCYRMSFKVSYQGVPREEVKDYISYYLEHRGSIFNKHSRDKLKNAFEIVLRDEECSASSINAIATISDCFPDSNLQPLIDATLKYAKKCLTPDYIKQTLVSDIESNKHSAEASEHLRKVFDEQFIADIKAEDPQVEGKQLVDIRPRMKNLIKPIFKLLKRQVEQEGKNVCEELSQTPVISKYVDKLIDTCKPYKRSADKMLSKINDFLKNHGYDDILRSFDRNTQTLIFLRDTCNEVRSINWRVVRRIQEELGYKPWVGCH